jgi:hypothetical protein
MFAGATLHVACPVLVLLRQFNQPAQSHLNGPQVRLRSLSARLSTRHGATAAAWIAAVMLTALGSISARALYTPARPARPSFFPRARGAPGLSGETPPRQRGDFTADLPPVSPSRWARRNSPRWPRGGSRTESIRADREVGSRPAPIIRDQAVRRSAPGSRRLGPESTCTAGTRHGVISPRAEPDQPNGLRDQSKRS